MPPSASEAVCCKTLMPALRGLVTAAHPNGARRLTRRQDYGTGAPASNQRLITARSASVMPVALFIGINRVTTTCW